MDIPYVTITVKDKKELVEKIALLNASSKNWSLADYVTAWASLSVDYVKLNHYFQVYDLEISAIASILSNNLPSGGHSSKKIKLGEFTIINEKDNVQILDYVTDMLKIIPRLDRSQNNYACTEYVKFVKSIKDYNHKKFMINLAKNKEKFAMATHEEGNLSALFNKLK